jgi:hypothetical protein
MNHAMNVIRNVAILVRNGLFLAASRTYGEQYIEPFIRSWYSLNESDSDSHDAIDDLGQKYEIKACKVLKAVDGNKKTRPILDRILFENENLETNRLISFAEALTAEYLANVQNVKRDHFDYLIYVLLFEDCVKIFSANKNEINSDNFISWSDKHGRYDAFGKSGQFGISKRNIQQHIDRFLKDTVSYEQMKNIYRKLGDEQE